MIDKAERARRMAYKANRRAGALERGETPKDVQESTSNVLGLLMIVGLVAFVAICVGIFVL